MVCIYYFQVETLLDKLRVLYDCLVVPQEERSSLCIKEAFSLEELCKVDKVSAIREEVVKWQAVKKENMAKILGQAKAEIEPETRAHLQTPLCTILLPEI